MDEYRVNKINELFDNLCARIQELLKNASYKEIMYLQDCILNLENFKIAMNKDPAEKRREQEYLKEITEHLRKANREQPPQFPDRPNEP